MPVGVVGSAIPRAIGLVALLAMAVLALRGFVPGAGGPHAVSPPSAVAVALMPVLSLVSVVILLAGVITSQHRLPLAVPDAERDTERQPWQLRRFGLMMLVGLAVLALFAALAWLVYLLSGGPGTEVRPQPSAARPTPTAPVETPPPTPQPFSGTPELSSRAMVFVGGAAVALVATAVIGLVVVAIGTRRRAAARGGPGGAQGAGGPGGGGPGGGGGRAPGGGGAGRRSRPHSGGVAGGGGRAPGPPPGGEAHLGHVGQRDRRLRGLRKPIQSGRRTTPSM
ncbi:hypothetical protein [Nocardia wallacei]|uniref:hypothetical protein n=1 Tax=Nocardia wallacei TaxID=480035 RepID=UPI00245782AD|nr:hypothetical protein [Nocardia wallacei]